MWVYVILGVMLAASLSSLVMRLLSARLQKRPWYCRLACGVSAAGALWLLAVLVTSPPPHTAEEVVRCGAFLAVYIGVFYRDMLAVIDELVRYYRRRSQTASGLTPAPVEASWRVDEFQVVAIDHRST